MSVTAESTPGRLTSLDAFRGITIAGMILVNNPGSWSHVYPPLLHAEWHGWTPTDLIFPFFLFIVGVAMTFSIVTRLEKGADRGAIIYRVLKRSLILIGLGLFLSAFPRFDLGEMRFPGVLQRIGLVYLLASVVVLKTGIRGQALTAVILLIVYWAVIALVPIPGFGAGNLIPDGNLAAHIPINKNLWTSSYVVFTSGAALQFLAVCYWLIDIRGWSKWAQPAVVFGMNAIAVFVLSGMLVQLMVLIQISTDGGSASAYSWIYQRVFVPWAGQLNGSLAFALANILLWYGMMSLLYRRKMFIKI